MNDLVKYLTYTTKLEKEKEKLAKIDAELDKINSVIEVLGDKNIQELYKYWDTLNKKEKTIKYVIAKLELEIAKFELEQAFAE